MDAANRASADQPPPLVGHDVVTFDVARPRRSTAAHSPLNRFSGTVGTLDNADLSTVVERTTPSLEETP